MKEGPKVTRFLESGINPLTCSNSICVACPSEVSILPDTVIIEIAKGVGVGVGAGVAVDARVGVGVAVGSGVAVGGGVEGGVGVRVGDGERGRIGVGFGVIV